MLYVNRRERTSATPSTIPSSSTGTLHVPGPAPHPAETVERSQTNPDVLPFQHTCRDSPRTRPLLTPQSTFQPGARPIQRAAISYRAVGFLDTSSKHLIPRNIRGILNSSPSKSSTLLSRPLQAPPPTA
jgi:hypothetical protein